MQRTLKQILSFGLKTYLAKKIYGVAPRLSRQLMAAQNSEFVQTAYGVEMAENWDDGTFRMCVFGGHGTELADILENLRHPFVFLDVGANQGMFTLIAAANPACAECLAFEPVPSTFSILEKNVQNAPASGRIKCIQAAVSATAGQAEIKVNSGHSGGATLADRNFGTGDSEVIETISSVEIDAMLGSDMPIIVKVDVEGFETVVLVELLKLKAADNIAQIFCEIDLDWVDFPKISEMLTQAGLGKQTRSGTSRHFDLLATRGG